MKHTNILTMPVRAPRRLFKAEFIDIKTGRRWLSSATYTDRAACLTAANEVSKEFVVSRLNRVVEFVEI